MLVVKGFSAGGVLRFLVGSALELPIIEAVESEDPFLLSLSLFAFN